MRTEDCNASQMQTCYGCRRTENGTVVGPNWFRSNVVTSVMSQASHMQRAFRCGSGNRTYKSTICIVVRKTLKLCVKPFADSQADIAKIRKRFSWRQAKHNLPRMLFMSFYHQTFDHQSPTTAPQRPASLNPQANSQPPISFILHRRLFLFFPDPNHLQKASSSKARNSRINQHHPYPLPPSQGLNHIMETLFTISPSANSNLLALMKMYAAKRANKR